MPKRSFGQYLVNEGFITKAEHEKAYLLQNKINLFGEIAIEMNFLNREDLPIINKYIEQHPDVRFGEAAVSTGMLNSTQLRYVLDVRTKRKARIGKILVEQGFINQETLNEALMSFDLKRKKLEKILVAEQSRTVARIIETLLEKHGYEVFKTNGGEKACSLAKEIKPDIILASGVLPDMDGAELCKRLLTNPDLDNTHMVIISSDDSQKHVEKCFDSGVTHFLKKPVSKDELINMIYQVERESLEKRSEKVLVVDDSRGARSIIRNELLSAGFTVHTAENGKQAIKAAKKIKPDIITMDLEMPEMGGFEACKALKENEATRNIPVIIVSSQVSLSLFEKGFEAGAVEYFSKPFKQGRLVSYVNMLLESKKIEKNKSILVAED
jgi:CheY-like chemotaxis protein